MTTTKWDNNGGSEAGPRPVFIQFDGDETEVQLGEHRATVSEVTLETRRGERRVKIVYCLEEAGQRLPNYYPFSTNPKSLLGATVRTLWKEIPDAAFDLQRLVGIRCRIEVCQNGEYRNVRVLARLKPRARADEGGESGGEA